MLLLSFDEDCKLCQLSKLAFTYYLKIVLFLHFENNYFTGLLGSFSWIYNL